MDEKEKTDVKQLMQAMNQNTVELADENEQLRAEIVRLKKVVKAFFKVVVIKGMQFVPGYPQCRGCEHLTVARGWECNYSPDTTECAYPDEILKSLTD